MLIFNLILYLFGIIQPILLFADLSFPINLPIWAQQQIEEDLKPHIGEDISAEKIQRLFDEHADLQGRIGMAHVQVRKGQLYFYYNFENAYPSPCAPFFENRLHIYRTFLEKLNQIQPFPDMDFLLNLNDCIDRNEEYYRGFPEEEMENRIPFKAFQKANIDRLPVFCFAAKWDHPGFILIPDHEVLATGKYHISYEETYPDHVLFSIPWENKKHRIYWRGNSTSGWHTKTNWHLMPRAQLVTLSRKIPRILNAKFAHAWSSQLPQTDPEISQMFHQMGTVSNYKSLSHQMRYKYLIDVEGNSAGCSRIYWILRSNSVLFRYEIDHMQWYYKALQPWVHYVPIKEISLEHIKEAFLRAKVNDQKMQEISKAGTELTDTVFKQEHIELYVRTLLENYAKNCCSESK